MMRNLRWTIVLLIAVVVTTNSSCGRDMYDEKKAQEINDSLSPVDVNENHTWQLTSTLMLTVKANQEVGAQWLQILTADPMETRDAEVAAQVPISDGTSVNLSVNYASRLTTLYAALVDDQSRYTVTTINPTAGRQVDFSHPLYISQPLTYTPQPQVYVFCYEDETPNILTADFDYNDVILNISYERTGLCEMRFHVELDAVGTERQDAAAIRLKNFSADRIKSITTEDNASFNLSSKGIEISNQVLVVQKKKDLLLESLGSKDAVINLFCDAHWATGDVQGDNYGQLDRKKYNVGGTGSGNQSMVPRKITYIVTFDSENGLNYLNFDLIDPFIINEYNGSIFEVHGYNYLNDYVLNEYRIPNIVRLPWALIIPYSKFRHPYEGVNIGFNRYGIIGFGAYGYAGHSFGEWAKDPDSSQDWYLNEYASQNRVY